MFARRPAICHDAAMPSRRGLFVDIAVAGPEVDRSVALLVEAGLAVRSVGPEHPRGRLITIEATQADAELTQVIRVVDDALTSAAIAYRHEGHGITT
jgi:hypothetical protein